MIPIQDSNPSHTRPVVTWSLILINVLVFLYEASLDASGELDAFLMTAGLVPGQLTANPLSMEVLNVFTSMFLHGGWAHLLGNMLYLLIFGDNIEDQMGHGRFVIFYLLGGVAAAAAQVAINPESTIPMVGASGAIAGVLGAYLVEFPTARVRTVIFLGYFVRFVNVPAVIVLGMWFVLQLFSGLFALSDMAMGGVAYFAHIGGFVAGVVLVKLFTLGRKPRLRWDR